MSVLVLLFAAATAQQGININMTAGNCYFILLYSTGANYCNSNTALHINDILIYSINKEVLKLEFLEIQQTSLKNARTVPNIGTCQAKPTRS